MTCSQSNCVPKARTPRICVTVLASQPSVNIETETTQRMLLPNLARLADRVQHFAQQFLIGDAVRVAGFARAFGDLAAESLDFVARHAAEFLVQRVARFELLAVDQAACWAGKRIAGRFVEITEEGKPAVLQGVEPSSLVRWKPEMKS